MAKVNINQITDKAKKVLSTSWKGTREVLSILLSASVDPQIKAGVLHTITLGEEALAQITGVKTQADKEAEGIASKQKQKEFAIAKQQAIIDAKAKLDKDKEEKEQAKKDRTIFEEAKKQKLAELRTQINSEARAKVDEVKKKLAKLSDEARKERIAEITKEAEKNIMVAYSKSVETTNK